MADRKTVGEWSPAYRTPGNSTIENTYTSDGEIDVRGDEFGVFVIHGLLLHTGNVLWWSGHAETVNYGRECIEWDPIKFTENFYDRDGDGTGFPEIRESDLTAYYQGNDGDGKPNIKFHVPPAGVDIFCSFHVHLTDGKILTMGGADSSHGTGAHQGHGRGIRDICLFDPEESNPNNSWSKIGDMNQARWYPTAVVMPDKRILIFSGRIHDLSRVDASGNSNFIAESVEVLSPPDYNVSPKRTSMSFGDTGYMDSPDDQKGISLTGSGSLYAEAFPTYPGMHLVKGSKVFYSGTNWRYESQILISGTNQVTSSSVTHAGPPTVSINMKAATNGVWELYRDASSDILRPGDDHREEGTSILLSPARDGKILLIGGGQVHPNVHGTRDDTQTVTPDLGLGRLTLAIRDSLTLHDVHNNGSPDDAADPFGLGSTFASDFLTDFPLLGNASTSVEILDTQASSPAWSNTRPDGSTMNTIHPRISVNAVNLVDGKVLILGGHDYFKFTPKPMTNETLPCEIFDPETLTFTEVASLHDPRMYHSSAQLLLDGSVVVAGGADPNRLEYIYSDPATANTTALNIKTFEIYRPPYLFIEGTIPEITAVEDFTGAPDWISYGQTFTIVSPQADEIEKVVLIRPGAMTHHTDTEQRHIPFIKKDASTTVGPNKDYFEVVDGNIQVPMFGDNSIAPPGYYMLFIIHTNGRPCSKGVFVHLDSAIEHEFEGDDELSGCGQGICSCESAAVGTIWFPALELVKYLRDTVLTATLPGKYFSKTIKYLYSLVSPPFTRYMESHQTAKIVFRKLIVIPLIRYLRLCEYIIGRFTSPKVKSLGLTALCLFPVAGISIGAVSLVIRHIRNYFN